MDAERPVPPLLRRPFPPPESAWERTDKRVVWSLVGIFGLLGLAGPLVDWQVDRVFSLLVVPFALMEFIGAYLSYRGHATSLARPGLSPRGQLLSGVAWLLLAIVMSGMHREWPQPWRLSISVAGTVLFLTVMWWWRLTLRGKA